MQRGFFAGPFVVRYFVDGIVSSQLGRGNSRQYRKKMCGDGFHVADYDSHGSIQGYLQLFGVGASAPYWSGILCAAVNNSKG